MINPLASTFTIMGDIPTLYSRRYDEAVEEGENDSVDSDVESLPGGDTDQEHAHNIMYNEHHHEVHRLSHRQRQNTSCLLAAGRYTVTPLNQGE